MSDVNSLPFHRKYRPDSLSGYIGNTKLKESIINTLRNGARPQVMMFYGDSGCGKTTIARLIAKEYLCEDRDVDNGSCGVCANCESISDYIHTGDTSNLYSIKEIDIASENGKRDLDIIIEDMLIPSFDWKIYILDECHKATDGAQNRLLKIVEEPPEKVLIIFCTTNPEEMLETLKNRCQLRIKVSKPTVKELANLERDICIKEDVPYDMKGLEFLANRAECGIRTTLQHLNRVVNEQGNATYNSVIKIFEEVSNVAIINFFKALKSNDVLSYISTLHKIKINTDLNLFLTELQNFVKRGIYVINGINLDGISDSDLKAYKTLFGDLGIEKISFLLNRLVTLDKSNLEIELITLGYTGLKRNVDNSNYIDKVEDIKQLDNECLLENNQAITNIKEDEIENSKNAIKNADLLTKEASIDILLSMGGILVDE